MVVLTFNRAKSVISVLLFASCCSAFSSTAFLYPGHLMGSKNKIKRESMNIRWATREAIQMPTSTPMVPYKVRLLIFFLQFAIQEVKIKCN